GAVARPRVCVRVACELGDVEVGCGDDAAMVVDVAARREDAASVRVRDLRPELFVDVAVVLLRPYAPVRDGAAAVRLSTLGDEEVLAVGRDLAQPGAHADPVRQLARLARDGRPDFEPDRAVHRSLLDGVTPEDAVLRVDPRARRAVALLAVGPGV